MYNLLHVVGFLRSRVAIIPIWRPPPVGVVPGDALKWERAGSHEMARCSYAAALRSGGNQHVFSYELGLNHQFFATPWPRGWSIRASATPAADRHGRALKQRRAGAYQNGKGSKKRQHQATVYLKTSRLILLAPPADKMLIRWRQLVTVAPCGGPARAWWSRSWWTFIVWNRVEYLIINYPN